MKVAILMSGQPRFLSQKIADSLHLLRDKYDCDVYCHFWWNPDGGVFKTSPWSGLGDLPIANNTEEVIRQLYSPKVLVWELPPEIDTFMRQYTQNSHPMTNYNLPCMYYSMLRSYQLMAETGIQYDWAVKLRYDEILESVPDLTTLSTDTFYSPSFGRFVPAGNLFFAPFSLAPAVFDIYNQMDAIYTKSQFFNDEQMNTTYLDILGIKRQYLPRDQGYSITLRS